MPIRTELRHQGRVAVLWMDNPPVNAMSADLREALGRALDEALSEEGIRAIVLAGAGEFFCCGAEIREFNTPASLREPSLRELIGRIERADKPVVAAVHGAALGGGLELALGCHYRVALAGAKLGLPEVKLGILPGAGGTQRLPRAVGVVRALEMIVEGEPSSAARALADGLLDAVFDDGLAGRAAAYAFERADVPLGGRVLGARRASAPADPQAYDRALAQGRRRFRGCVAPEACVACVRQAVESDLEAGLAYERRRFQELVQGSQSRAQRHLFFAERVAMRTPAPGEAPARVGVVGAGTMGGGIAMSLANAGLDVVLVERDAQALERGWKTMQHNYAASVAKGRLSEEAMRERLGRIRPSLSLEDLGDAGLVIEAAFEDMAVKRDIFTKLDAICAPHAILASNTSRLDIDEIAGFTARPARVLGMHFFSPANVMRLLEVVRGKATSPETLGVAFALARRMGKLPVLVGVCDGFVGNRMVSPYTREAHFLLEEGASPRQVDGALERFGLAMGPLRMADMAGLDISWAFRKRTAPTRPRHLRYSRVADRLCEQGRFGQKTGAGFYRYEAGSRAPVPDPEVDALIEACAREDGIERQAISDETIVARTMYALVNEGARILEEGIASCASDIDVIYVHGYGFPAFRGGPLFYACEVGLPEVLASIRQFHARHGELWEPAPLLERLVREGKTFYDL